MNKLLLVVVLMTGTSIFVTGCTGNSPTTDKAKQDSKEKAEEKKDKELPEIKITGDFDEKRFDTEKDYATAWITFLFEEARKNYTEGNERRSADEVEKALSKLSTLEGRKIAWSFKVERVDFSGINLDAFRPFNAKIAKGRLINDFYLQFEDRKEKPAVIEARTAPNDKFLSGLYVPHREDEQLLAKKLSKGDTVTVEGTILAIKTNAIKKFDFHTLVGPPTGTTIIVWKASIRQ